LAAVKTPELGVERIHRGLAEVNSECSVLLHKTASEIRGQNDVIRQQNDEIRRQNHELLQKTQVLGKIVEELRDQNRDLKLKVDCACVPFRLAQDFHATDLQLVFQACTSTA
jgi:hypothetical protein